MSMAWFRMYAEFGRDPKVQLLDFEMQRHYVMLLCAKCDGTLDSHVDPELMERMVAKYLSVDVTVTSLIRNALRTVCLISDNWQPLAWDKRQRQGDHSGADRMRRYRENSKSNLRVSAQKRHRNVSVTSQLRTGDALEQNRTEQSVESAHTRSNGTRRPEPERCKPPPDWSPSTEHLARLSQLCPGVNLLLQAELFRSTPFQFAPGDDWADKFTRFVVQNFERAERDKPVARQADKPGDHGVDEHGSQYFVSESGNRYTLV